MVLSAYDALGRRSRRGGYCEFKARTPPGRPPHNQLLAVTELVSCFTKMSFMRVRSMRATEHHDDELYGDVKHRPDLLPNSKASMVDDYWSLHPGGCNFVFCDGSVRFVKESVNPNVFSYLSTRAGGEVVSADQF